MYLPIYLFIFIFYSSFFVDLFFSFYSYSAIYVFNTPLYYKPGAEYTVFNPAFIYIFNALRVMGLVL